MKNKLTYILVTAIIIAIGFNIKKEMKKPQYKYESYEKDGLKTRFHKLENGLKVYLSVYKDAPRVQTYIAIQ